MSRLLKLAKDFNCFYFNKSYKDCTPFFIEDCQVGFLRDNVVKAVRQCPEAFVIGPSKQVTLNPGYSTPQERSDAIHQILSKWRSEGLFPALKGWRNECFDVKTSSGNPPLMKMERTGTCLFGVVQYGVHINGYVIHPEKGTCLWLQQRSSTKPTWPGKWDSMVGGGMSSSASPYETAVAESQQEASIPHDLLINVQPAGSVSFFYENERGVYPSVEYVYDLELPGPFVPHNADGEVDSFELVPVAEVTERILSSGYKESSAPVALDFLIRHGHVNAQNEPYLADIIELLHFPLHVTYNTGLSISTS